MPHLLAIQALKPIKSHLNAYGARTILAFLRSTYGGSAS